MSNAESVQPWSHRDEMDAESRLLKSALTIFSEKGYAGASIREIIEGAQVTRPVLYYYFENKEALYARLVDQVFARIVADIDAFLEGVEGAEARLHALARQAFEHTASAPEVVRLLLQVYFGPNQGGGKLDAATLGEARWQRYMDIMQEGIDEGLLAGEDAEGLALMFEGILAIHVMAKAHDPSVELSEALADRLVKLFLGGARLSISKVEAE